MTTAKERLRAARLVVTAGAWAGPLLGDLGVPLVVRRKPLFWYKTDGPHYRVEDGAPTFFFETAGGLFYGFPEIDRWGLKVAEHSSGETVDDPLNVDREIHQSDRAPVEAFLSSHLPSAGRDVTKSSVCMYTMTPDEHFLVGLHPRVPQVAFTAGLSGHGFKFAPVFGEILADLVTDRQTRHPIEFLSPTRALS